MDIFLVYTIVFFLFFLVLPTTFLVFRFILWIIVDKCDCGQRAGRVSRQNIIRNQHSNNIDRQGNVFTIHDEANRESRFNDIFFIEPNSVEAARIRAQLEKDEKDLPSYEEVMRMTNLSSPTAAPATVAFGTPASAAGGAISVTASSSSVNTTETTLTIPQYTEVDLSATSRPVTPPPYSPPATPVILATANSLPTQHISSSNV